MESVIVAYSFIGTTGVFILYVGFLYLEIVVGKKIFSESRSIIDRKILYLVHTISMYAKRVKSWYKGYEEKIKSELIVPMIVPIEKIKIKIRRIATGRGKGYRRVATNISPHLKKLNIDK